MLGYLRLELRRVFRDGGYLMMSLVLPIGLYLLVTRTDHSTAQTVMVQQIVSAGGFGALGVAINSSTGIAEDRAAGWLRQLRLTPLSPMQVVLGRGLSGLSVVALPLLVVGVMSMAYNGVRMSIGHWVALFLVLWIGIVPILLLGIAIGYLFRPQLATIVATLGLIAFSLLGGLFLPVTLAAGWVQAIAHATPIYRYSELSSAIAVGRAPSAIGLVVLVGWTAMTAVLAAAAYRRSGRVV